MIVQCSFCGAPNDVKAGARSMSCGYCGRSERVRNIETLHAQTPANWAPPAQWTPPPGMRAQFETAHYRPRRSGAPAAVVVAVTLVPLLFAGGIILFASGGFAALGGMSATATPTLGVLVVGAAPVQRTFNGTTSGMISRSSGFGHYAHAPTLRLVVSHRCVVSLGTSSHDDTTLLIRMPNGVEHDDDDGGEGINAALSIGLEPGTYPVWIGNRNEDVPVALTVSAFPVNALPGPDGLAFAGPPLVADVTLGPGADPMRWTTDVQTSVETTYCGSHVTPLPQLLVHSATPRLVTILAHGDFDSTLVVRDATGHYGCDDDSGQGNDARIEASLPAGVTAIWLGDRGGTHTGLQSAMLVLEPHVVGETPPAPMLMPEARAALSTTDLDEMLAHHLRDFSTSGTVHGYLDAGTLRSGCPGHLASSPTVSLRTAVARHVVVRASGNDDLVLASRGPNGEIQCNDDSDGNAPRLDLHLPPGETDIWAGPYGEDVDAELRVSVAVRP